MPELSSIRALIESYCTDLDRPKSEAGMESFLVGFAEDLLGDLAREMEDRARRGDTVTSDDVRGEIEKLRG